MSDAVILFRIVSEDVPAENGNPIPYNPKLLDVNEDGMLTVADVTAMLQHDLNYGGEPDTVS